MKGFCIRNLDTKGKRTKHAYNDKVKQQLMCALFRLFSFIISASLSLYMPAWEFVNRVCRLSVNIHNPAVNYICNPIMYVCFMHVHKNGCINHFVVTSCDKPPLNRNRIGSYYYHYYHKNGCINHFVVTSCDKPPLNRNRIGSYYYHYCILYITVL